MVNGTGRVNGLGRRSDIRGHRASPLRRPTPDRRWRFLSLVVALLMLLVGAALLMTPSEPPSGFTLDGGFADWNAKALTAFTAATVTGDPALNLRSYAVHDTGTYLLLWVQVEGLLFSDPVGLDTVHVFLDADADAATGYRIAGLGADHRFTVSGGGGAVEAADAFDFFDSDQENWRAWRWAFAPEIGRSTQALEIQVLRHQLGEVRAGFLAAFLVEGNDGTGSMSRVAVGGGPAAVTAVVSRGNQVVSQGSEVGTVALILDGTGEVRVESMSLDIDGPAAVAAVGLPVTLTASDPVATISLLVTSTAGAQVGDAVHVAVTGITANAPVTLEGGPVAAYLLGISAQKRIDGLFEDWAGQTSPGGVYTPSNPDVNLVAHGAARDATTAFVYARVVGTVLKGGQIPHFENRHSPPTGEAAQSSPGPPTRTSAEDRLSVFIDEDPASASGGWVDGVRADWWIDVLGRRGRVTETHVYAWDVDTWTLADRTVSVAAVGSEIELSVGLALPPTAEVLTSLRDWRGNADATQVFGTRGTRGDNNPAPTATAPPDWTPCGGTASWTDFDEGLSDPALEIREVQAANCWPDGYIIVRFTLEASAPTLTDNSYWIYVSPSGAPGPPQWLVEELSTEVCTYNWDATNGDWGVGGSGCDVTDTLTDTDVGSAVRTVSNCWVSFGCVDFALEKSDYPGIWERPWIRLSTYEAEDFDLLGNTTRDPTTQSSVQDISGMFEIAEFSHIGVVAAAVVLPFLVRRRCARRPSAVRP
ncbi:MAG TPA: hypothetical protein VJ397_09965 [Thermoplasmata archaeon]|nr:hypothetical protein [Thermoplasmata archaeon]